MGTAYPQPSTPEPVSFDLTEDDGTPITGANDVTLRVYRISDAAWWDWSDSTFKAGASVVDLDEAMTEPDATRAPGRYEATWPGGPAADYEAHVLRAGVRKGSALLRVGGLAAPGDAMALTSGERTTVQALVLSDATPFPGARIDAAVSSRSSHSAADVWASVTRTLTGVGSSGVASQSSVDALPTASSNATAVWAYVTRTLTGIGSSGIASQASVDALPTASSTAAAVWATAETGADGTMGYAQTLMRKWITNQHQVDTTSSGRMRLFDDDNSTVLLTWTLRDGAGNAITTPTGSPAQRGAAT